MAKTITQLDDAGALQNNNFFEVIQGGLSKKTTFQNLVESMPRASNTQDGIMSARDKIKLDTSNINITYTGSGSYILLAKTGKFHFNQGTAIAYIGSPSTGLIGLLMLAIKQTGNAIVARIGPDTVTTEGYYKRSTEGCHELWVKISSDINISIIPVGGNGILYPLTVSTVEPAGLTSVVFG